MDDDNENEEAKESSNFSKMPPKFLVLPLYSMLPPQQQMRVFNSVNPQETRLVVVATNIAETSITIPGIIYVVDSGRVRVKKYDHVTGMEYFKIEYSSKASVNQRAGRAGRTAPGVCFRIFSSAAYNSHFPEFTEPEIFQTPIDNVVLSMKNMGIDKIEAFPFPSVPDIDAIRTGIKTLIHIGALDRKNNNHITSLGRALINFPVLPRFAKMLLLGEQGKCLPHIVAVVACMSVGDPFLHLGPEIPEDNENEGINEEEKEQRKKKIKEMKEKTEPWQNPLSDLLKWLNAIGAYEFNGMENADKFCYSHFLHAKTMKEIHDLRIQLTNILNNIYANTEDPKKVDLELTPPTNKQKTLLRQIICAGFVDHVAKRVPEVDEATGREYKNKFKYQLALTNTCGYLNSESIIAQSAPDYIVYHQLIKSVKASKPYFKGVTVINPSWLPELAEPLITYSAPLEVPPPKWDPEADKILCFVTPTYGPNEWVLPHHQMELPGGVEKYRYFARYLLEGIIVPELQEFQPFLIAQPNILTKQVTNTSVASIIQPLIDFQIDSKKKLIDKWRRDKSFLLSVFAIWISKEKHARLKEVWPPIAPSELASKHKKKKRHHKKT
eukprot:TRINITY_DN12874_c0_g1_i1.p1 TRINITY_DN12874_c0_g1~~TRINITY_DN12874_c0_g1_i1.p1  ORF type:complete len:639 (+),score=166.54 TRINITY_DN12874_c0_g1_i1:92-1918(+)